MRQVAAGESPSPKRRGRPPSGGREAILRATLQVLREHGVARMTTREVARRAGVSEGSVFYHYGDRAGLLMAVFVRGLEPLQAFNAGGLEGESPLEVLTEVGEAIARFLDEGLPVMVAAQSDRQLPEALAAYMSANDLGPQRGVENLAAYLLREQRAARLRSDVPPRAVATMLVASTFLRVFQQQLTGSDLLPGVPEIAEALMTLLSPNSS